MLYILEHFQFDCTKDRFPCSLKYIYAYLDFRVAGASPALDTA
jgi:hypothetical protein